MNNRNEVSGASPKNVFPRLDNTVTNNKITQILYKTNYKIGGKFKIILCGHHIEIYEYEKPLQLNRRPFKKKKEPRKELKEIREKYRKEEYRKRTKTRVVGQVQRLVESNFGKDSIFLTLTFNNENNFDITDLKVCNLKVHNFMADLKKRFENLKYITVPEFQKRGAVHYHLIINVPFIEKKIIQKLWKYGFVKLKDIYYLEGIGNYFTKYLTKNSDDDRLYGKRSFFTSKNLRRPRIKYGEYAEKIIQRLKEKNIKPYFLRNYRSQFNGDVKYMKVYIENPI